MNSFKSSEDSSRSLAKISVFKNAEFGSVRTAVIDGEPFFVGKDVATVLGYKDTADAVKVHVDEDDKGVGELPTPGGKQKTIFINESGSKAEKTVTKQLTCEPASRQWYTIEELASLCGLEIGSVKNVLTELRKFGSNFEMTTKTVNVGGHRNVKEYSGEILRAIKEYQLKNSVPNATKDKGTVIGGNISFVQQETVKQTIDSLLDNPQTLQLLLTESLSRQQSLQIENKMMKDVIAEQKPKVEYVDSYCDATNLEEIGHLGKVTKIGEQKIFKRLLDDGYIKVRYSTDGVKCYDPCYDYEKYFGTVHVPFLRGDRKLSRDKLMLTHRGFMYFRSKYAPKEMLKETAD